MAPVRMGKKSRKEFAKKRRAKNPSTAHLPANLLPVDVSIAISQDRGMQEITGRRQHTLREINSLQKIEKTACNNFTPELRRLGYEEFTSSNTVS